MHGERWPKRLGLIAALATLVIAGCARAADEAGEEGRAAAARFLDELRAGRLEPAWQGTSTEFKSLMGLENLRDYVKTHPALKAPAEYAESRTIDRDGRAMAEYVFHATTQTSAANRSRDDQGPARRRGRRLEGGAPGRRMRGYRRRREFEGRMIPRSGFKRVRRWVFPPR